MVVKASRAERLAGASARRNVWDDKLLRTDRHQLAGGVRQTLTHGVLVLCQEMDIEGVWGTWSWLRGTWQSEFVQALKKHRDRAHNE
jgi:hypothetical protein